ncbi:hypothetical protein [Roseivirga sp. E12]|uniref:hypothetical protein n=1 Tax=Roseivirga sp. E12 TaxID=2819237 RepID=UPI001ABD2558|nr:hypothetical protein [Roseivirga sp. E12]MBO3700717.1 hypothetical protein [Roseivirga sp. E12]
MLRPIMLLTVLHIAVSFGISAQTLNLEITKGTDLSFTFNTIRQYTSGVVLGNATEFTIDTTVDWDLYVGTETFTVGQWDLIETYSSAGTNAIPVSILEIRADSPGRTSQQSAFFPLQDIATPTYLIGSNANDISIGTGVGTNDPGDPIADPFTHKFRVSYKLTPGINYAPGIYSLTVVFTVAEDL